MKRLLILLLLTFNLNITYALGSAEYCGKEAYACVTYGANVFHERCSLCHGSDGHGEGILSMQIKNYPNTNLLESKRGKDIASLTKIIRYGIGSGTSSREMPPWGDELTAAQLDSVAMFVQLLHSKRDQALKLLKIESKNIKPSTRIGRGIYQGRCALCHGKGGEGDGKMSRIIKKPPPFDLTKSKMPDAYLKEIINKGGKALGRSSRMPPWSTDLSDKEVDSVILYIKTLRH